MLLCNVRSKHNCSGSQGSEQIELKITLANWVSFQGFELERNSNFRLLLNVCSLLARSGGKIHV